MDIPSETQLELFYETNVLPHFFVNHEGITWQGHSDLDIESGAHYFKRGAYEFLLVNESYAALSIYNIQDNTVGPHQHLHPMKRQDAPTPYVRIDRPDKRCVPDMTGYFTLFEIRQR